ncbi:MAG: quinone-dependent dihydroorotate dehydrogenase [Pseudomonadota bacterium]
MTSGMWDSVGRWLAFRLEAEKAHGLAVAGLKTGQLKPRTTISDERLRVSIAGLDFPNPIGVAAGFDKNAEVYEPLLRLGFGFSEVGTLTPLAQPGNPRPRVFRLPADHGVINRLGFNNDGHAGALDRMKRTRASGIVGVNIGANKDSTDRIADYVRGIETFCSLASYFTVNISSPNTPGLRDLQTRDKLSELLSRVVNAMHEQPKMVPIFLKIAPDVAEADLDDICTEVLDKNIDGMIVSNTTLSRTGLKNDIGETGGLSGRPVFERSTIMLAKVRQRVGKELALIGVGGVESAATASTKIEAGADLVQLYTGMIYQGPHLAQHICKGLLKMLRDDGLSSVHGLRDRAVDDWAGRPLPT